MTINADMKVLQAAFINTFKKRKMDMDAHGDICQELAEFFDLYDNGGFPVWLSRVVDGWMRDAHDMGIEDLDF